MSTPPPQTISRPYRVTSNKDIAKDIFELRLSPVDTANAVPLPIAGQWVYLELPDAGTSQKKKSAYSLACAPSEMGDGTEIVLGIALEGDFTHRARQLKPGDTVMLQGPFGVFTLPEDVKDAVFFAGGIGITPLRSMIRESLAANSDCRLTLFYSCRSADVCAWLDEFRDLAEAHDRFTYIPICTRDVPEKWEGETGRISAALMDKYLSDYNAHYFVCGPQGFMDTVIAVLNEKDVEKARIHQERFV